MGCRCCKMIQSYLFDPVPVASPGYINEVSSCKLDEDDPVKLKSNQSSEILVHKNVPASEGFKRTEGRGQRVGPQEPCWPHQEPLPQEDAGGGRWEEKPGSAVNGVGPTAALQPTRNPRSHQRDKGSRASPTDSVHPTQPFLEGGDTRTLDCVLPALEKTQVVQSGDFEVPSKVESFALEIQGHDLQIPTPDYPQLWGTAVHNVDHEEKDYLFKNPQEGEPLAGILPRVGEHGLNVPFPRRRSWDSLNEAVTTEVLSVYFKEQGPVTPVANSRIEQEETDGSGGNRDGEVVDEDAAVAEALAALEAATAGEDLDEAD
ncbi:PDCD10 and GCKIII kinases-associated protein 1 [Callospermophilus lateralis]|uniref:PDCD10 and GCKIII kinases-associated protein 1 n=1 Tax=Callospermophilus lateralis TaxID=76772 RepID=UPI004054531D